MPELPEVETTRRGITPHLLEHQVHDIEIRERRMRWLVEDDVLKLVGKTISSIENILSNVDPDFIFCHFPDDTHQDHRHLSQATMSATRNLRNVLFYEGPTTCNFIPQVFVDVSDTLDRKIESLEAHASQMTKTNIKDLSILEIARSSANFRGIQGRVKNAEAFHALRLFINI